ncbi:aldo/keto reductase [Halocatena pleomorpha]|uniref:Aldo/keto reductase n=1 Tax=Halocatena pleomorpha TaxID=1785090 RepID=A0A3P3RBQ3_9EURY|nr:aldo/keto reductase [Halocatena pleomorpha]RRJ30876.1 aldo/keto reductase [Halocatena pleomorpha]
MATNTATWAYRDRFPDFARTYFRRLSDCVVSSIGVGTYLGDPTDAADRAYHDAVVRAIENGVNVVDTAINYRHQRSERAVGRAIQNAETDRESVFVATKGGFVPFDRSRPDDPQAHIRQEYLDSGIINSEDLARGVHCIRPSFIDDQLDRSLDNLGVDTIDLYYVHNPETQLETTPREQVYDQLEETFTRLEERALAGHIRHYGVATWECFRVPQEHDSYLSLPEIVERARNAADRAGTDATHFRAIQLPFNVHMADAFTVEAHESSEGLKSALRFAHDAGLNVFTSASIGQGELARSGAIPDAVAATLNGDSPVQRAINFARSAPGVTSALVGMHTTDHVDENVAAGTFEPMGAQAFDATFE